MAVDLLARTPASADAVAVVTRNGVITYGELNERVDRRAEVLASTHPDPATPVVRSVRLILADYIELFALWRAGVSVVPLHPRLSRRAVDRVTTEITRVPPGAQVVVWTSGTSGTPKGVALSAENLEASAAAAATRLGLSGDDLWLAALSAAHVGGLALLTRSVLLGASVFLDGDFETKHAAALMLARGLPRDAVSPITHVSLVPTQLSRILEVYTEPPPRLRCALIGGAHAPKQLVHRALSTGWPLALTYGATEMTSQIATASPSETAASPGSVGRPLDGVEVELAGDGEILTRGPTLALGLVGEGGTLVDLADSEGWYHTGDFGHFDEEDRLWIVGRRSDRIISGGVTVDAREVEEALRDHPAVLDACVVGLPDKEWGERVVAWIEHVEGEYDPEEVDAYLAQRLSPAKRPRGIRLGMLPRNANGKADRDTVREAFNEW